MFYIFVRSVNINSSWCCPTAIVDCTAHHPEKCCVGKSKAIPLAQQINIQGESISVPSAMLLGQLWMHGADMKNVETSIRRTDHTIAKEKINAGKNTSIL